MNWVDLNNLQMLPLISGNQTNDQQGVTPNVPLRAPKTISQIGCLPFPASVMYAASHIYEGASSL